MNTYGYEYVVPVDGKRTTSVLLSNPSKGMAKIKPGVAVYELVRRVDVEGMEEQLNFNYQRVCSKLEDERSGFARERLGYQRDLAEKAAQVLRSEARAVAANGVLLRNGFTKLAGCAWKPPVTDRTHLGRAIAAEVRCDAIEGGLTEMTRAYHHLGEALRKAGRAV